MKCISKILFFATLILLISTGYSQTIDSLYEVGTWQGFRSAAVSFTFDDNCSNQTAVALPMFDEYNFKMTFYPVINWSPNWSVLQTAAANGHEVGSHTVSHPHLGSLDSIQQVAEIKNSRDQINSQIGGNKCITIAYPYCETGNVLISEQFYIAGRTCSGSIVPRTPSDFMRISSFICGTEGLIKTAEDFSNKVQSAVSSKGWVVFLIHGIDNDGGYSPVTNQNLRGSLEFLNSNRDKYWVATFSNVVCYIKERNSVSVDELSFQDSSIILNVTDTLNNFVYNYPVTVRRFLPEGWDSASVTQNGEEISSQIIEINSQKFVMFDVVPDEGDIQITGINITGVLEESNLQPEEPYLNQNYPNPFNPETKIGFTIPAYNYVTLKIYDVLGKEITTLVNEGKSAGYYETIYDAGSLSGGIYFYQLKTNTGFMQTKKFALLK